MALFVWFTGAVQHQRLVGQEQGSHPGVRRSVDAGVQGAACLCPVQRGRGRSVQQMESFHQKEYGCFVAAVYIIL